MDGPQAWLYGDDGLAKSPGLPFGDRGFRYGMHFFETLLVSGGKIRFLGEHLAKLAENVHMQTWPMPCSIQGLARVLEELEFADGILRIFLTAGDGAPTEPVTHPRLAVTFEPCDPPPDKPDATPVRSSPFVVDLFPAHTKSGNYWRHIHARQLTRAAECLVYNSDGVLVGASMANAFLLYDGGWHTPSAESGRRAGVIHDWVLARIDVTAAAVHPADAARCSAMFLTNSRIGILPVNLLDGRELEIPAPIHDLQDELRRQYENDAP